jgi:hypothetical protein
MPLQYVILGTIAWLATPAAAQQTVWLQARPPITSMPGHGDALYALSPGHWQLHGAESVWVSPQTKSMPVRIVPVTPGKYVWRNGKYVWIPRHYAE